MQTGPIFLTLTDLQSVDTTQQIELGTKGVTADGRGFRYVRFGGTAAIASGLLLVTPAAPANSTGLAISTANTTVQLSKDSHILIVTNGATAVTQDQFKDGYLEVLGTNGNQSYQIVGNTAAGSGGAITVELADGLRNTTALANGTNTVNLRVSPYADVAASTTVANPVGVNIRPVVNSATVTNYGWVQTSGETFVLATTATKGTAITQDTGGTAGYVMSVAAATSYPIGIAVESAASNTATVMLNIA